MEYSNRQSAGSALSRALRHSEPLDLVWPERLSNGRTIYAEIVLDESISCIDLPAIPTKLFDRICADILPRFSRFWGKRDSDTGNGSTKEVYYLVEVNGRQQPAIFTREPEISSIEIADCPSALARAVAKAIRDSGFFDEAHTVQMDQFNMPPAAFLDIPSVFSY